MNQLLKRLEIIKHAISVEDEDIIDLQIRKIKVLQNDLDTCMILELIDKNDYETVIDRIDQYLSKHKGLITYVNPKVQGLKLELKILENELNAIFQELTHVQNTINEFNLQYHLRLGELVQNILRLRQQILSENAEEDQDSKTKYEEAKSDYDRFHKENVDQLISKSATLSIKKEKELKELYKSAAKRCHPDIVGDEFKQEAEMLFKELNDAYRKKDLLKIRNIYERLQNTDGFTYASESINDEDLLKVKIEELHNKIELAKADTETLKRNEVYCRIKKIDDWDKYFLNLKRELTKELEYFENHGVPLKDDLKN